MKRTAVLALILAAASAQLQGNGFAKGADISWVSEMQAAGRVFRGDDGQAADLVQIIKDHGMDSVRFRVWVNPADGYNGLADTIVKATHASRMGMRILVDFHYSDSWADPGKQTPPAAWAGLGLEELEQAVYQHTYDTLVALREAGVHPEWVQVGNETNDGMLWPAGKASASMANFARLVNAGYDAVKAVDSSTQVIVHISNGHDNGLFRWILDGLKAHGGKWDITGMSLYPNQGDWRTMNAQCLANMNDMAQRHGRPVMMVETGMPQNNAAAARAFLEDLIAKCRSVDGGQGLGVFYWEPQSYGWRGYPFSAWDADGTPTVALDAFLEGSPRGYRKAPDHIGINTDPGIQGLTVDSVLGQQYRIQTSSDLTAWAGQGPLIEGTGDEVMLPLTLGEVTQPVFLRIGTE